MAAEARTVAKPPILDINEDRWAEAVRREATVLRVLSTDQDLLPLLAGLRDLAGPEGPF